MPRFRVTSEASKLIQAGKKAGKSSRDIERIIKERLGISISARTISRHILELQGQPRKRSPGERKTPPSVTVLSGVTPGGGLALPERETLDEIEALEREASTLQRLLAADLPPRDRAALNAELRQTFASIRKANAAKREVQKQQSADLDWLKRKLKRFAEIDGETLPERDADADSGELPEAPRAAGVA